MSIRSLPRSLSLALTMPSAAGAIVLAVYGCSNMSTPTVPLNLFASAYAQALCGSLNHCCVQNQISFDSDTCTSGWKSLLQTAIDDPSTGYAVNYDEKQAAVCLDLVRAEANQSCVPIDTSQNDARTACELVFVGKKAPGTPCNYTTECAPQPMTTTACVSVAGPVASTGGTLPLDSPVCISSTAAPPMMGDPCVVPTDPTAIDPCDPQQTGMLRCDATMMSTCQPYLTQDDPCTSSPQCANGFYCGADPEAGLTNVCAPTLGVGSACPTGYECDGTSLCVSSVCVARKTQGESCTNGDECSSGTCDPTLKICLTNKIATSNSCAGLGD